MSERKSLIDPIVLEWSMSDLVAEKAVEQFYAPPTARDWKPGEKILIEAVVQQSFPLHTSSEEWMHVKIGNYPYCVPLSSIHQMRKEGE